MAPQTAMLPALGHIVAGKYLLKELIGQGGMGSVFAAEHTSTGKQFALKIMLADPTNQEAMDRFKREARAAGKLVSEHVVDVIDVAEENGYAFMVLELLRGEDLGKVLDLQRGPLPVPQAVGYVMQALDGIGAAHAQGIVHRDLKPSNLFRAKRIGGGEVIKVLDFGISKVSKNATDERPEQLTSTKAMLGSPLYMSPEQLRSSKTVDSRADIWALGVILYELLTNSLPFHGETLGELFAAILEAAPTTPSARNSSLPPGLDAIILRCLRLRPDERFATCDELKRALAPFATAQGNTMLASTAFMPGAQHPQAGRITGPGQMTPPNGGPPSMQHAQPVPVGAAATGSGVHPPVVRQMGSTPQPGWGNTTGGGAVPKSNGPVIAIAAVAAILVLAVVGGGGVYVMKHRAAAAMPSAVASETPPPPPEPTTPASVVTTPASVVTAATTAAPPESASATVAANTKIPPQGHNPPKPKDPPKVVETPPPPPPPPRPTQQPTAKPTATTLQENSR